MADAADSGRVEPAIEELREIHTASLGLVRETPTMTLRSLSRETGGEIVLKAENLQRTGSFKLRGSLAKLRAIDPERCASFEPYSPDRHVSARTPPAFIYHTTDDELVPVEASVSFYRVLAAAGVPVEMHLFATGRPGSGLGLGDAALDQWPALLETWLRGRGLLAPAAAPAPAVTK